ncbi:MAG: imidazole glycerol phosphate synthase subunit HisH [Candidatus Faecousia sp.]|nr:imidazole glycerol phosphate synthase subunit HisH [Clostridiales bacterium]MDY6180290.1 imidazole glycerol phosphate synthase subunit HisH [Candidatus Faecousia sp.]
MIGIIDYGVGNLFSLCSSCRAIGEEAFVSGDAAELSKADRLILPGVGAFADAAEKLRAAGMADFVRAQASEGKPLLGICLGMQLLFEKSYEYGCHEGLGLLAGQVVPMAGRLPKELKIPHMGWNALEVRGGRLLQGLDGQYVYFVHSFFAEGCEASLAAVTEYGIPITAAVEQGNVFGCQFHPEKSGNVGLSILRKFAGI